ncbi:hypothetical protein MEA186_23346 [Mesorhizobium amorphae CCNWGS0123]|uniref:Uncharacterized protein n=1 Tax=Mesorhizobium amorphae CCNWGS0123 TaxID=1082933 RepID=G6YFC2_9HYPH|nr:hypothetical protein MEA186_23346 [Mesorhizobium amorphae CCNWGS0123]
MLMRSFLESATNRFAHCKRNGSMSTFEHPTDVSFRTFTLRPVAKT